MILLGKQTTLKFTGGDKLVTVHIHPGYILLNYNEKTSVIQTSELTSEVLLNRLKTLMCSSFISRQAAESVLYHIKTHS